MSYFQFQQQCLNCKEVWTAAFGLVGTTIIAEPPVKCWICKSTDIQTDKPKWEFLFTEEIKDSA